MSADLHRRAERSRGRARIREWEARQHRYSKGSWYRYQRVLAAARLAFEVGEEVANTLIAEGYSPEAAGRDFDPPKIVVFVPEERIRSFSGARQLELTSDPRLLNARWVALVAFDKRPAA